MEEQIQKLEINNILLFPYQSYDKIASVFSLGDVDLIISKPGIGQSSIPSKTWGIMAAGRPIVASFDIESELSKLIRKIGCGKTPAAGNKHQLLEALMFMYRQNTDKMGMQGRSYVEKNLDKNICINKYLSIFNNGCQNANSNN